MRACFRAFLLARLPAVWLWLVGLGRVELPTSPLSGVRSNQLSYRPSILVELIGIEPTTS